MCTNERTLLTVFVAGAQLDTLPQRFRAAVLDLLSLVSVPQAALAAEADALSTIAIARTVSRSILASMNDLARHAKFQLSRFPHATPLELAAPLLELPLGRMGFHNSLEAATLAFGAV